MYEKRQNAASSMTELTSKDISAFGIPAGRGDVFVLVVVVEEAILALVDQSM